MEGGHSFLGTYIEEFEFLSWGTSQIDDLPAGNVFGEGVPETLRRYKQMLACWSFAQLISWHLLLVTIKLQPEFSLARNQHHRDRQLRRGKPQ